MRTDQDFREGYRALTAALTPGALPADLPLLGLIELCLTALAEHLPTASIHVLPVLMTGYTSLATEVTDVPAFHATVASLRHLCGRFGSPAAWLEACQTHAGFPEVLRCYDLQAERPVRRAAAPPGVLQHLRDTLRRPVPWARHDLRVAVPGPARIERDHNRTVRAYEIPALPHALPAVAQHTLLRRSERAPLQVSLTQLRAIAREVDAREAAPDWPDDLPPLHLAERLDKSSHLEGLSPDFFADDTLTLAGVTHVVGMLSSGKSTLVMGLIFALAQQNPGPRLAVIVTDTLQGATLSARLRRHGIPATVLASLSNRERHLDAIHWRQSRGSRYGDLAALGELGADFGVGCPLDGLQTADPELIQGDADGGPFPLFAEKPCHKIKQSVARNTPRPSSRPGARGADEGAERSCPFWPACPAQGQQRAAVAARVLIMTPQAFLYVMPDQWTLEEQISLPELLQYTVDLVICDEVDAVQQTLDAAFVPVAPIMGREGNNYTPAVTTQAWAAIQNRSGAQFKKPLNCRWTNNFGELNRQVGHLYAIVQNEAAFLHDVYLNTPFSGVGLLDFLRRRAQAARTGAPLTPLGDGEFRELTQVASAIGERRPRGARAATDAAESLPALTDAALRQAALALQEIGINALLAEDYRDLLPDVEAALGDRLQAFCILSPEERQGLAADEDGAAPGPGVAKRRKNALILLLAVVAEVALDRYHWLIKAQPAVAGDFDFGGDGPPLLADRLIKQYRNLLPGNPAGSIFGLLYDEPSPERAREQGGTLSMLNHLGVGRFLLTHLHDLLRGEGQAGPHVLMLSGTSWAGGSGRRAVPGCQRPIDSASPTFDVQVPVAGVLIQPPSELAAIRDSRFALVPIRQPDGSQVVISGAGLSQRRGRLIYIAERFAIPQDGLNLLEQQWQRLATVWSEASLQDRRRALLVVNSYADAAVVADTLHQALPSPAWRVYCLEQDQRDGAARTTAGQHGASRLPRSLIEAFGRTPEHSVLVAPLQIVARGHNILNEQRKAAIAAIYFLHRPHPRPDDFSATIGRLNRLALEIYAHGLAPLPTPEDLGSRAQRMRRQASRLVRRSLECRGGYSSLPTEFKAQFAWDMLTPLWQTIGRGIRGGCPVFCGFVDAKFAPRSFAWQEGLPWDDGHSSPLVQALQQLRLAMDPTTNPREYRVARLLYAPFFDALNSTEGLKHGHD